MSEALARELHGVPAFSDVPDEAMEWLAAHMQVDEVEAGQVYLKRGSPADRLLVVLEGELRIELTLPGEGSSVIVQRQGQVTGMLPYSRLKVFPAEVRADARSRIAMLRIEHFPEMLERFPILGARLVAVMADRIRDTGRVEAHREKLAMLGKISAGLAHELNNPAAAAKRAAENLRESVIALRRANLSLDRLAFTSAQRADLAAMEQQCLDSAGARTAPDPLERSDREQVLGTWLDEHGIADAWELAATLADEGVDTSRVEHIASRFPSEALADILRRIAASLVVGRLVDEIDNSTSRISELVKAVKEYSYLDQGPDQEIDIHSGLENTLLILRHRLKRGIRVIREFDRSLPKICANGSELNQVWTNLMVNAIEAMGDAGELRIRTSRDGDCLLVEIIDNGPGIPPEVQGRLFEPFFTTKAAGDGTGLGLEASQRIIRNHRGDVRFETRPGHTDFQVRLPYQAMRTA